MADYGRIRYVESYMDAPQIAQFIIRERFGEVVFERYSDDIYTLAVFPNHVFCFKKDFEEMLTKCRKLISSSQTIWCECPIWKKL